MNMFLNDMMKDKHMTRAHLRRQSGLPESTLRNILNGTTQLDHCEAATLLSLANVMGTTVKDLLCKYWAECGTDAEPEAKAVHDGESILYFYMMYEAALIKRRLLGDIGFIREMSGCQWIERFYSDSQYRIALFLLGLVDYLSRQHHLKPNPQYDEYRKLSLDQPVYSPSTMANYDDPDAYKKAMAYAETCSIPELARFNIYMTREDINLLN